MTLGKLIADYRHEHGISMQEIANRTGLSKAYISILERNFNPKTGKPPVPSLKTVSVVARAMGMSFDDVISLVDQEVELTPAQMATPPRIPILGSIPAGIPIEAIEDVVDWEEIPATMLSGDREYFGLRVTGSSMYPEYIEGDTIIVRKTRAFESGDTCVVYVNGYDATLKRVKVLDNGSWLLIPRNPEYETKTYTPDEVKKLPVTIAGVVVELRRKV